MYPSVDAIFDILVERAGAHESLREEFRYHWPCGEFRFQGVLGFGGKVWYGGERNPPRVTCYREDESEERQVVVTDTNRALMELWLDAADSGTSGLGSLSPVAMRQMAEDGSTAVVAVLRHHLRDAADRIEAAPRDIVYRWRSDPALKRKLSMAIRGGCPEIFDGVYSDFPDLIVDSVFDVLEDETRG